MIKAFALTTIDNGETGNDCSAVFIPAAKKFKAAYNATYAEFHNAQAHDKGLADFLKIIDGAPGGLDIFAYFGHGFDTQLGNHIWTADGPKMGMALKSKMKPGGSVVLYSCRAGVRDGLTTTLCDNIGMGIWVYGHTTYEHSFKNTSVSEVHQGDGPKWKMLNELFGPDLAGAWAESLERTDLWLRFPLMQHDDIIKELNAARLSGSWITPAGGTYAFEWPVTNGAYATFESICVNPTGTVTDSATRRTGTWELDDELVISWSPADREIWPRPISPDAQRIKGAPGFAKRTAPKKYGEVQG